MTTSQLLGTFLIALPFVGVFIFGWRMIGLRAIIFIFLIAITVLILVLSGACLLSGAWTL